MCTPLTRESVIFDDDRFERNVRHRLWPLAVLLGVALLLAKLPRGLGILIVPKSTLFLACVLLCLLQCLGFRSVSAIPPGKSVVHHFDVDVPVPEVHVADNPAIP